jgi:phosphate transport system substrate-binding protein
MSDSSTGLTSAIDGTCDIAMASRELKEKELEKLTPLQIAIDGIAVIVNKENTTKGLSSEQVKGIFTGKTTAWKDVK